MTSENIGLAIRTMVRRGWMVVVLSGLFLPSCQGTPSMVRSVVNVTHDLSDQVNAPVTGSRTLVIDPLLDSRTGQQTVASLQLQQAFVEEFVGKLQGVQVVPFDGPGAAEASLLLTGSMTALNTPGLYRMSVALTDTASGIVVAQSGGYFREEDLDISPTPFYRESPSVVRDRSVEGYLKTATTERGEPADALYMEQVPTSALLAGALEAYNGSRWKEALKGYQSAAERKDGQQLRTFNGIYLCNVHLRRMTAAASAFDKIVALGLATGNLAVKLLFRPGSTDFWPNPKVSGVYPMWLERIAIAAQGSTSCLSIVGHTSSSGTVALNEALSLKRAEAIKQWLNRDGRGLGKRIEVKGMGFRENLVGTGADDATDAIDRRVEFKVVPCPG